MFQPDQEISLEKEKGFARTSVRGWRKGAYLLVDIPEGGWNTRDRSEIVARLFHEGAYHGFTTRILGAFIEIGLMALAWPEETIDTSYRESERFPVTAPVTMYRTVGDKTLEWEGLIIDISRDGCQVICEKPLQLDTFLFLKGPFPDGSAFETIGFVIKSRDMVSGRYRYGGRFEMTGDEDERALAAFLKRLSVYRGAGMSFAEPPPARPRIEVGARCQAQISRVRYNSILRGSHFPRFALMDIPSERGKPVVVHHHAEAVIRFESKGTIYGFESQVIKQYTHPFPLWVIQYPEEIQTLNLRKSRRVTTFLRGRLVSPRGAGEGAVVDLSEGGGLFASDWGGFQEGERLAMELFLPSGEKAGPIPCVARSIKPKGRKTLVGLSFTGGEDEQSGKLRAYYLSCARMLF